MRLGRVIVSRASNASFSPFSPTAAGYEVATVGLHFFFFPTDNDPSLSLIFGSLLCDKSWDKSCAAGYVQDIILFLFFSLFLPIHLGGFEGGWGVYCSTCKERAVSGHGKAGV